MRRFAASFLLCAVFAAGCAEEGTNPQDVTETVPPVAEPLVDTETPTLAGTEAGVTIVVVLEDNVIGMPTDRIPVGPVVFTVRNAGSQLHSFAIQGPGVDARLQENLATNDEGTMEVIFQAGTYRAWCPLHEAEQSGEAVEFEVTAP